MTLGARVGSRSNVKGKVVGTISEWLSIGQVGERTGLSVHALRYYEREGLFTQPVVRDAGGRRCYGPADVDWLRMCSRFRASGMPVTDIRRYSQLVAAGPGNEHDRLELLRSHQRRVEEQLAELAGCRDVIAAKVAVYTEHLAMASGEDLWAGEPVPCLLADAPAGDEPDRDRHEPATVSP